MKSSTILTILVVVLVLASISHGSQSLTVDNQPEKSITLKMGQRCTVEVASTDSMSYVAYVGFDDGLVLGSFTHLETKPEAGNLATAAEYSQPTFYGYYVNAAGFAPAPSAGVHFVFEYVAQQLGETDLKLYDETLTLVTDSIHITIIPAPMGTALTYQGRLIDANAPADGLYDFEFKLFNDPCTGTQQGSTIDVNDLDVIDGYFTVELDFGSDVFDGDARWLDISVRPGDVNDPNAYTVLSPRQEVTPVPYALQTRGLFVDDAGNVGIGTTNPDRNLDIRHSKTGGGIEIDRSDSNIWSGLVYENDGDEKWFIGMQEDSNNLLLKNDDAGPSIVIEDDTGNVGIGTTTPTSKLEVKGGDFTVTGKVGIGTTGPDRNLDIRHSNSGGGIEIDRTANNIWSGIVYENNGAENWFIGLQADSDDLLFKDNAAGVSMVIEDGTGNVGIGTTSPTSKLHVEGTIEVDQTIQAEDAGGLEFATDEGTTRLKIADNGNVGIGTTSPQWPLHIVWPSNNSGIRLDNSSGAQVKVYATSVGEIGTVNSTPLSISTNNSSRIYIDNVGHVGIGDTLPAYRLELPNIASTEGQGRANAWSTYSSRRWKTNIRPIENALEKVKALRGVSFDWKADGTHDVGMIAEEVGEVIPEVVGYEENGEDAAALDYGRLVALLIEAIKEQQQKIGVLEEAVAQNELLKQRLETLEKKYTTISLLLRRRCNDEAN